MAYLRKKVRFEFIDREGNTGMLSFWIALSVSGSALAAFINTMADLLQSLSNASIRSIGVYYQVALDLGGEASPNADVNSRVLLYYRTGDVVEVVDIPSPKAGLFEVEGDYAGVRVLETSQEIADLSEGIAACTLPIVTREGETFPLDYWVGGLML